MDNNILRLEHVSKSFGSVRIIDNFSLAIKKGEFVTLLGPSGCGKTTTLRIIAGLERVDSGTIFLGGKDVTALEANARNVNTVFQNYALFPHMNVYNNVCYGPKIKKTDKAIIKKKAAEMLALVRMEGFEKRMPHQLSGGQRQRIAIARALINEPDVILLDEPLGALDLSLRRHMQVELKQIQQKTGITFVYVTHDQEEALNMSDIVAVMNGGKIEQYGEPREIYERPVTLFTAEFVGERNIFRGKDKCVAIHTDKTVLLTSAENVPPACVPLVNAVVENAVYAGSETKITVKASDGRTIKITEYNNINERRFYKGDNVFVTWKLSDEVKVKV